ESGRAPCRPAGRWRARPTRRRPSGDGPGPAPAARPRACPACPPLRARAALGPLSGRRPRAPSGAPRRSFPQVLRFLLDSSGAKPLPVHRTHRVPVPEVLVARISEERRRPLGRVRDLLSGVVVEALAVRHGRGAHAARPDRGGRVVREPPPPAMLGARLPPEPLTVAVVRPG